MFVIFNHWVIAVEQFRKKTVFQAACLLPWHCRLFATSTMLLAYLLQTVTFLAEQEVCQIN